jgi:chromosome segregation ATPase
MESGLESFALLEKKTLALGRRYQELLEERNSLRQQLELQAKNLNELETEVGSQKKLLDAVDVKMLDLLGQIDEFLQKESHNSGNIQVLPGMYGS